MTSGDIPTDPLFGAQWHLRNTGQDIMGLRQEQGAYRNDINVTEVWQDYTGKGVVVSVIDDGVEARHPDLDPNSLTSRFYDLKLGQRGNRIGEGDEGEHGTAVAGLIWGARNDRGGVGVAFGSEGISFQYSNSYDRLTQDVVDAVPLILEAGAAISSNSIGFLDRSFAPFHWSKDQQKFSEALTGLVRSGRNGLGIATLFAAGNEGADNNNTLFAPSTSTPFAITIGAANADGTAASYSTPGPNVLVAAPGSGGNSPVPAVSQSSIVTSDLAGRAGYNEAEDGDYTDTLESGFNGTSAATPIAAGVVALMLEANPGLGYRDVQEILASSARTPELVGTGARPDWKTNGADDWNGGGHRYTDAVGFGLIDARAAVRLAETWRKTSTYGNLAQATASFTGANAVAVGAGDSRTLTASFGEALRVQHVAVSVDLSMVGGGSNLSAVTLELRGPNGRTDTRFIDPNAYTMAQKAGMAGTLTYTFDTVRNWGEMGNAGAWALSVRNVSGDSALTMTASITLMGDLAETGRTLVYTDDYAHLARDDAARTMVSQGAAGPQHLNAAAVTGNTVIDLAGRTATIAGVATGLAAGLQMTTVVTGDGSDRLTGTGDADSLGSGRGNDTLQGGGGRDSLSAGAGDDLALGQDGADAVLGGAGNDFVSGGFGSDTVLGEAGNDLVFGDDDDDWIDGNDGDDLVHGGTGIDTVFGSAGGDLVFGEDGDDFVGTGSGNDFGSGGFGDDEVHGEAGNDLLFGDDGNDGVYGGDGDDLVYGGTGHDHLTGDAGEDRLYGQDGGDGLSGGAGNDTLDGGTGTDLLFGNSGDDVLTGGAGIDVFAFGAGDGLDRILDFVLGGAEADVIAFNGGAFADFAGVQAASRQDGADLVIAYGAGDALTLAGVQLGTLSAASFAFA